MLTDDLLPPPGLNHENAITEPDTAPTPRQLFPPSDTNAWLSAVVQATDEPLEEPLEEEIEMPSAVAQATEERGMDLED